MKKLLFLLLIPTVIFPSQTNQPLAVQPQFYREYPTQLPVHDYYQPRQRRPMKTSKLIAISAATSFVTSCITCLLLTKVRW